MAVSTISYPTNGEHLTSTQGTGAGGNSFSIGKMVILNMSLAKIYDSWTILSGAPKPAYEYIIGYVSVNSTNYPVFITTDGNVQIKNASLRFSTTNLTGCYGVG